MILLLTADFLSEEFSGFVRSFSAFETEVVYVRTELKTSK